DVTGSGIRIQGCYVGTNAAGTAAAANDRGILLDIGSSGNIIGTDGDGVNDAAEGNLISGNTGLNVYITGSNNNTVSGNTIGVNAAGTAAIAGPMGIEINFGSKNNLVGTNSDGVSDTLERNVISGNSTGISVQGVEGANNNRIAGNYIGTNLSGTTGIANGTGINIF